MKSGGLHRNGILEFLDLVFLVQVNKGRFVSGHFIFINNTVATDDHPVTGRCLVCCSAIDGDDTRAIFCANGIGREPFTVGNVVDLYLLEFANTGFV